MTPSQHTWIKPLARAGYTARGIIYLVIGYFAIFAALDAGEKKGAEGALSEIMQQPLGTFLIWALIIGLAGYVLWRLVQSVLDTDDHGVSPQGLMVRAGLLASAFTYTSLAVYCLSLLGIFSSGENDSGGIAKMMSGFVSKGIVSLGLALIFAGVAGAHWWKAAFRKYEDHFEAGVIAMRLVHPVSMIGLFARGCVFAIISLLLFYRFWSAGSSDRAAPGIKDAMTFVQQLPYGQALLVSLGVGLLLFACYSLLEAWFRRINVEDA